MNSDHAPDEIGYRASDYNSFCLSVGYAESTFLSSLTFVYQGETTELRPTKVEAWNEAFDSLASVLLEFSERRFGGKHSCCVRMPPEAMFCSSCGANLSFRNESEDDYRHFVVRNALGWLWTAENHETPEEIDFDQVWSSVYNEDVVILRSFVQYRAEEFVAWFTHHRKHLNRYWNSKVGFWDNVFVEQVSPFSMVGG